MENNNLRVGYGAADGDALKRMLLIDSNGSRCELRARALRQCGLHVDCASGAERARAMWVPLKYRYILMDLRDTPRLVDLFWREILSQDSRQRFSFYVGKPAYLASAPPLESADSDPEDFGGWDEKIRAVFDRASSASRWGVGLREAGWRIAAAKAMRQQRRAGGAPTPEAGNQRRPTFGEAVRMAEKAVGVR